MIALEVMLELVGKETKLRSEFTRTHWWHTAEFRLKKYFLIDVRPDKRNAHYPCVKVRY